MHHEESLKRKERALKHNVLFSDDLCPVGTAQVTASSDSLQCKVKKWTMPDASDSDYAFVVSGA